MSMPGMGVMIGMLGGNKESVETIQKAIGKKIKQVELRDDALHFEMEDGFKFRIEDGGQSCCESRYMKCDDTLSKFVGDTFLGAEVKDAPNEPDEYGDHEVAFLEVRTSGGIISANTHNEHNGYYGGFYITARPE